jgi:hypothetical protein
VRPKRTRDNNIKIDLKETRCEVVDQIKVAQDRVRRRALVDNVMNLRVS